MLFGQCAEKQNDCCHLEHKAYQKSKSREILGCYSSDGTHADRFLFRHSTKGIEEPGHYY